MNFLRYLTWAISPSQVGPGERWRVRDLLITGSIGLGLAAFAVSRIRKREFVALFCCGWLAFLIAPMLPLPNHVMEYYLTIPLAGLAWLGGWAVVTAWRAGWTGRAVALVLMATYLFESARQIDAGTLWYRERTDRMRVLVLGVKQAAAAHPGAAILLDGVDQDLYDSGFVDEPFRLFGAKQVYLAGSAEGIRGRDDMGGVARFVIPQARALGLIETEGARVLRVSRHSLTDITSEYESGLRVSQTAVHHDSVDVGDPVYAGAIGPTWYPVESGFRWMPRTATVTLSAPSSRSAKFVVKGYAPAALLASGPVVLRFRAMGRDLGTGIVRKPEGFSMEFRVPPDLAGKGPIEISVEVNKVLRPAGEQRDLGMIFGRFEFR